MSGGLVHVAVGLGDHAAGRVPHQLGHGQVVGAALQQPLGEAVPQVVRRELLAVLAGQLEDLLPPVPEFLLVLLAGGGELLLVGVLAAVEAWERRGLAAGPPWGLPAPGGPGAGRTDPERGAGPRGAGPAVGEAPPPPRPP